MNNGDNSAQPAPSSSNKGMSTGTKVALGCGGCAVLLVVLFAALAFLGALARTGTEGARANNRATEGPLKISAGELFRAYQANAGEANELYREKYIQIVAGVSNTKRIFKSIKDGADPDSTINLDGLVASAPSESDLQKESTITGIPPDQLRGTFPSVGLELSGESRRPAGGGDAPGMGTWGDVLLVFDTHPEDLKKLKVGQRVQIVGRVDGWLNQSVQVKDCHLVSE